MSNAAQQLELAQRQFKEARKQLKQAQANYRLEQAKAAFDDYRATATVVSQGVWDCDNVGDDDALFSCTLEFQEQSPGEKESTAKTFTASFSGTFMLDSYCD